MAPDLNTILDAAMQLPADERQQLITKLSQPFRRKRTPGAVEKCFGIINSGDPRSADNDKIDSDLAAAYLSELESHN